MRLPSLVLRELANRRSDFLSGIVAVAVGIAVGVGVRTVTQPAAESVMSRLHGLGSGFVVMPRQANIADYLQGRGSSATLPMKAVDLLSSSGFQGLENLTPMVWDRVQVNGKTTILTGVLPSSEIKNKPDFTVANLFSAAKSQHSATAPISSSHCEEQPDDIRPPGPDLSSFDESVVPDIPAMLAITDHSTSANAPRTTLPLFDTIGSHEVVAGFEAARLLNLERGAKVLIHNNEFSVADVMAPSGGIDDLRVYGHLNTVQEILGVSSSVAAIEVLGCCVDREGSIELIARIEQLLPNAKVVTVRGVFDAREKAIAMAGRISVLLLMILMTVGGLIISLQMASNVNERRIEIGTLVALGASKGVILWLVLGRALTLGALGGLVGYSLGTVMGVLLAPRVTGFEVDPLLSLLPTSLLAAVGLAFLSSLPPLFRTLKLDPALALMDQ